MTNETCKFCESAVVGQPTEFDHGCGTKTSFECGSRYYTNCRGAVDWVQCENCKDRELAALRQQLATANADRDEERENSRILRSSRDEEIAIADAWMRKCNELEQQIAGLQQRIDAAPVARLAGHRLIDGGAYGVDPNTFATYRLVAEPEPSQEQ